MENNEINIEQNNHKKLKIIIVLVSIACLIFIYSRYIETSLINVKETPIYTNKITEKMDGLKIVQFSDILYGSSTNDKTLDKLVDKLNKLNADIVIFTGDLISNDYKLSSETINLITEKLSKINSKYGKYAVRGDNDYKTDTFIDIMEKSNFIYLDNIYTKIYINNNEYIYLSGINTYNNTVDYNNLKIDADIFKIIITHKPDDADIILNNISADIIFAGHSLLGQFRIPFLGGISNYDGAKKYQNDYYEIKNTKLFITSGIGTLNYPFRLFNRPEINLYRIIKK